MAKYIDADTVVGLMQFDDYGRTVETDTIENILDNFTEDGCPEEVDVIPRDEAIKIFKYLEPPRFDLDCWGRLEKSAEHDIWEIYFKQLQNLGKVNVDGKV